MKLFIYTAAIFFVAVATPGTNAAADKLRVSSQHRAADETKEQDSAYFEVKSNIDESYCLDVQMSRTENFTPVQMYKCNGSAAQKFTVDSNGHLRSQLSYSACVEMDPAYGVFLYSPCQDSWQVLENDYMAEEYHYIMNVGQNKCIIVDMSIPWVVQNGDKVISGDRCPFPDTYPFSYALWKIVY